MLYLKVKELYSETSTAEIVFKTAFISFSSSELICKARGLLSSRLNIPIIDFTSTTYLSDTISKSHSKAVTAFTKFLTSLIVSSLTVTFFKKSSPYKFNYFVLNFNSTMCIVMRTLCSQSSKPCKFGCLS